MSSELSTQALVLRLSSSTPAEQIEACSTLMHRLQQGEITAPQLLQLDCIPPLLLAVQSSTAPDGATPVASSSTARTPSLAATRLLHQLQLDSHVRLFAGGWSVATNKATGTVTYREVTTGKTQSVPPSSLPPPEDDHTTSSLSSSAPEPEWVGCLLAELPLLCSPLRMTPTSPPEWAVRVRFHQPADASTGEPAVSVIDVRPEIESGGNQAATSAAASATLDASSLATEGTSRQLVLGPWHGIACAFRETESDLSYAPGEHLENFYTVTMAAIALIQASGATATAAASSAAPQAATTPSTSSSPRILLIGLGGGSLLSFLHLYSPCSSSPRVEVVELHRTVVRVAGEWFGVRTRNAEGRVSEDKALSSGFAFASSAAGALIHTCDAVEFLTRAEEAAFDVVLLDVYTSGVFPPALLTSEFFAHLARVTSSSPSSSSTPRGTLAVNAGVGKDRERVLQLVKEAFGVEHTRLLLDRKEVTKQQQLDPSITSPAEAAENGVVVGGALASRLRERLSLVGWRKHVAEARPADARPLPFELAAARNIEIDDAAESNIAEQKKDGVATMHLTWRGVELDKYAEKAEKVQQRKAASQAAASTSASSQPLQQQQQQASKSDAAWALFD